MNIAYQMPSLAGALYSYHTQYGGFPEKLETIAKTGFYGNGAYRLPADDSEDWDEHSGPEAFFVPVFHWDGKTPYVIAVQPPTIGSTRLYLMIGDTSVHSASEEQLRAILQKDDAMCAKNGEPRCWSHVQWQAGR